MKPSRTLTDRDASLIRALLAAGMMQSDVASLFGCNGGRVAEINTGSRSPGVAPADLSDPQVRADLAEVFLAWTQRVSGIVSTVLRRTRK
jgi:hypothetical protein